MLETVVMRWIDSFSASFDGSKLEIGDQKLV